MLLSQEPTTIVFESGIMAQEDKAFKTKHASVKNFYKIGLERFAWLVVYHWREVDASNLLFIVQTEHFQLSIWKIVQEETLVKWTK